MTLTTSTLRPGLLVHLSTSCRGNVQYDRIDLEDGRARSKWETTKTTADPDEHERAVNAQVRASALIRRVCTKSAFGLLCPESNVDILDEAIAEAERIISEFNSSAKLTRLHLYIMKGRIAADDVEAVKKISREVRELMDDMTTGIANMDVKAVREAAAQAKEVSGMLTAKAQASVQIAIDQARALATEINKAIKTGEVAALQIDKAALRMIAEQRTAFLDLDDEVQVLRPAAQARAIDLAPTE